VVLQLPHHRLGTGIEIGGTKATNEMKRAARRTVATLKKKSRTMLQRRGGSRSEPRPPSQEVKSVARWTNGTASVFNWASSP
jgi:hypothetical protein